MRYKIDLAWWRFIRWLWYLPFLDGGGRIGNYYIWLCYRLSDRHGDKFDSLWVHSALNQLGKMKW